MRAVRVWEESGTADGRLRAPKAEFREGVWRRDAAEVLGVARCPCCRAELVARVGPSGPYFACGCPGRSVGERRR
jgi:hypothetical protein